jgi:hypothetical protein
VLNKEELSNLRVGPACLAVWLFQAALAVA